MPSASQHLRQEQHHPVLKGGTFSNKTVNKPTLALPCWWGWKRSNHAAVRDSSGRLGVQATGTVERRSLRASHSHWQQNRPGKSRHSFPRNESHQSRNWLTIYPGNTEGVLMSIINSRTQSANDQNKRGSRNGTIFRSHPCLVLSLSKSVRQYGKWAFPTAVSESRIWDNWIADDESQGKESQLTCHNMRRPAPLGTMRGTMVFAANAAKGAMSINVCGQQAKPGKTLLAGDFIGFGTGTSQQVVMVTAQCYCE